MTQHREPRRAHICMKLGKPQYFSIMRVHEHDHVKTIIRYTYKYWVMRILRGVTLVTF